MATTLGFNGGSQESAAVASTPVSGRNWLELAQARSDPMMQFMWDIDWNFPPGLAGLSLPVEMVEDIQLPLSRFDVDNVFYQGRRFYYAKFEEFSPVSIKFYEDVRGTTTTFFQNWRQVIRSENGDYELPVNYMGSLHIYPLDQRNQRIFDIIIEDMFPMGFGNFSFTSGAGRQEPTIEFQFSRLTIRFNSGNLVTDLGATTDLPDEVLNAARAAEAARS